MGRLVFERAADLQLIVAPLIVDEYLDVITRPRLVARFRSIGPRNIDAVLTTIAMAQVVFPQDVPKVSRDTKDDIFLAAAVEGNADFIVTEDRDMLDIGTHQGVRIVTAEEFLRLLDEQR